MTLAPASRSRAGSKRERQVVKHFRQRGFVAFRMPASLGVCDVVALKKSALTRLPPGHVRAHAYFIEVKCNRAGGPFMNFRRPERAALLAAAKQAGATPLLAYWPPNKELQLIEAEDWPKTTGRGAGMDSADT